MPLTLDQIKAMTATDSRQHQGKLRWKRRPGYLGPNVEEETCLTRGCNLAYLFILERIIPPLPSTAKYKFDYRALRLTVHGSLNSRPLTDARYCILVEW